MGVSGPFLFVFCNISLSVTLFVVANRGLCSSNTSGVTGVFFDRERQKWVASITYNHKRMLLGRFASKEDAVLARLTKEAELFKEFAPQRT